MLQLREEDVLSLELYAAFNLLERTRKENESFVKLFGDLEIDEKERKSDYKEFLESCERTGSTQFISLTDTKHCLMAIKEHFEENINTKCNSLGYDSKDFTKWYIDTAFKFLKEYDDNEDEISSLKFDCDCYVKENFHSNVLSSRLNKIKADYESAKKTFELDIAKFEQDIAKKEKAIKTLKEQLATPYFKRVLSGIKDSKEKFSFAKLKNASADCKDEVIKAQINELTQSVNKLKQNISKLSASKTTLSEGYLKNTQNAIAQDKSKSHLSQEELTKAFYDNLPDDKKHLLFLGFFKEYRWENENAVEILQPLYEQYLDNEPFEYPTYPRTNEDDEEFECVTDECYFALPDFMENPLDLDEYNKQQGAFKGIDVTNGYAVYVEACKVHRFERFSWYVNSKSGELLQTCLKAVNLDIKDVTDYKTFDKYISILQNYYVEKDKLQKEIIANFANKLTILPPFYCTYLKIRAIAWLYVNKRANNITDLINLYEQTVWQDQMLNAVNTVSANIGVLTNRIEQNLIAITSELNVINKTLNANANMLSNDLQKINSAINASSKNLSTAIDLNTVKLQDIKESNERQYINVYRELLSANNLLNELNQKDLSVTVNTSVTTNVTVD